MGEERIYRQGSGEELDEAGLGSVDVSNRRAEMLKRLRRIEGQVRGIQRMLAEERECNEVVMQLLAIRSGLDEVSLQIIDLHLERCVLDGIELDPGKRASLQRALHALTRFPYAKPASELIPLQRGSDL